MIIRKINGLDLPVSSGGSYLSIIETTEKILIEKTTEITENIYIDKSLVLNGSIAGNNNNPVSITSPTNINGNTTIIGDVNITGRYLVNGNPFTATPGGDNGQLQYNNNGTLAGIPDFIYGTIQTPIGPIVGLQASFIDITNVLRIRTDAELVVDGLMTVTGSIEGPNPINIASPIRVPGVSGVWGSFSDITADNISATSVGANSISAIIKNAIVQTQNYGTRLTYCMEASTVRFYDEGKDTLVNGEKRIDLDPIFLETIEGELYIYVTPLGPASLYISEKGTNYFVVKSVQGNDVEFNWMVSATRKGYAGVRLEEYKK